MYIFVPFLKILFKFESRLLCANFSFTDIPRSWWTGQGQNSNVRLQNGPFASKKRIPRSWWTGKAKIFEFRWKRWKNAPMGYKNRIFALPWTQLAKNFQFRWKNAPMGYKNRIFALPWTQLAKNFQFRWKRCFWVEIYKKFVVSKGS